MRYDDVYFHDTDLGWAINSSGEIFKTEDAGESWDQVYSSGSYLRSIEFINENRGWVSPRLADMLETTDGGKPGLKPIAYQILIGILEFLPN